MNFSYINSSARQKNSSSSRSDLEEERSDGKRSDLAESIRSFALVQNDDGCRTTFRRSTSLINMNKKEIIIVLIAILIFSAIYYDQKFEPENIEMLRENANARADILPTKAFTTGAMFESRFCV